MTRSQWAFIRGHPRRALDHAKFFGLEDVVERLAVLAVAQQEAQGLHPRPPRLMARFRPAALSTPVSGGR
ncbi:hypothetical protein [Saccharothrix deserti]|uniref:hypothetical protein n=1 Tax=Saccharothrix deserti TaxID=2593674 RepID=UPI00192E3ADD|nr:hypothetical protein [Saccharothrix deserti]